MNRLPLWESRQTIKLHIFANLPHSLRFDRYTWANYNVDAETIYLSAQRSNSYTILFSLTVSKNMYVVSQDFLSPKDSKPVKINSTIAE